MYKLFAGDNYYPMGGYNDYRGSFDTLEAAQQWLDEENKSVAFRMSAFDWAHVVKDDRIVWYPGADDESL